MDIDTHGSRPPRAPPWLQVPGEPGPGPIPLVGVPAASASRPGGLSSAAAWRRMVVALHLALSRAHRRIEGATLDGLAARRRSAERDCQGSISPRRMA
jgi:hypothetical protein